MIYFQHLQNRRWLRDNKYENNNLNLFHLLKKRSALYFLISNFKFAIVILEKKLDSVPELSQPINTGKNLSNFM